MWSLKRLWRRRVAVAIAVVGAAATSMGASQCGTSGSTTVTVSGNTLTIYASAPSSLPATQANDVLDAEQLALKQSGSKVGKFSIAFARLGSKPSDNARTTIQNTSAIAYLGELDPGTSADSMGITEDQDLLQVSPTDTAIALTQSSPVVPGAPKNYYESFSTYGRTFARVVPSGTAEARAQVQEMQALGVKKLYVADDGSDYGKAIAYAVQKDASAAGIIVAAGAPTAAAFSSSAADAMFLGASSAWAAHAAALFTQVGSTAKLFIPSALNTTGLASALGQAKLDLYATEPGFLPRDESAAAKQQFVKPFEETYGHAPATEAIFGYEAMSAVLAVLNEAGSQANDRSTIVHDFFRIRSRASVLGTYSINSAGDTSIAPFVVSRFRGGAFVPVKFVQASP